MNTKFYIITDGQYYTMEDYKQRTTNINLARKYELITKAENILRAMVTCKSSKLSYNAKDFSIKEIEYDPQELKDLTGLTMVDSINATSLFPIEENVDLTNVFSTEELNTVASLFQKSGEPKIKNSIRFYENQLIYISRAISDIYHYKEFNPKRSASARCKLDVFETKLLLKRREIKDNIFKLEQIKSVSLNLGRRKYEARILNGLLENNEIPDFDVWYKNIL